MTGFSEAWAAVDVQWNGETVSPRLRPLLQAVYAQCLAQPHNLVELKRSLEGLLTYLAGEGRTNANCWAVDLFFCTDTGWERNWAEQKLPEEFHDVLATMGGALHDTVHAPAIAENFDSLPEQLLERVRGIPVVTP
jgi:hypothetical protein